MLVTVREAESPHTIARAADMGIAGYVDSWAPEDVQGAIEVAMRRHREEQRLQREGRAARSPRSSGGRVIERAKGILMERHALDERAAFELLRDHARSSSRRVLDVAQSRARRARAAAPFAK